MFLKTILSMAILLAATTSSAQVCGLLTADMFNGQLSVNIADSKSYANKQQNFNVLNFTSFDWSAGSCLCVEGHASYDPDFGTDYLYMQIEVQKVVSRDSSGESCKSHPPRF